MPAYLRVSDSVAISLAYVLISLGGQGVAFAADAVSPLDDSAGAKQGEVANAEVELKPGSILVVAGRVHFVSGTVRAVNEAGFERTLQKGDSISVGDTVTSAEEASAQIRMEDGGLIALRPATQLKFDSFVFSGKEDGSERCFFTLVKGGFRAVTGLIGRSNKENYRITTPAAIVGINGTDHEIFYQASDVQDVLAGAYSKVNVGGTTLTTDIGAVSVEPNQMGYSASMDQLPQLLPINTALFDGVPDLQSGDVASTSGPVSAISSLPLEPVSGPPDSATQAEVDVVTGQAEEGGGAVEVGEQETEVAELEEPAGAMFVLAPISWGGNVSESFRKQEFGGGEASTQNVQTVNLLASTYIWQPWLAQVNGGIGVVNAKNVSGKNANDNASLNGKGALSLVPYSRFPFLASYYSNDSRSGSGGLSPEANFRGRSDGFALIQRYRPQSSSSNSVFRYNRDRTVLEKNSAIEGGDKVNSRLSLRHDYHVVATPYFFGAGYDRTASNADVEKGPGVLTELKGDYAIRSRQNALELNVTHSENKYALENLNSNHFKVTHRHRPDSLLTINNGLVGNQSNMFSVDPSAARIRSLQFDSSVAWQPDIELPFYVLGGIRTFDSVFESSSLSERSQSQVGSASVTYHATPQLRYVVHEILSNTQSGSRSARTTATGGGVTYNSSATNLGSVLYNWNANGGIDYVTNTSSISGLNTAFGAGHDFKLPYELDQGVVTYNFNQSIIARKDVILGQNNALSHSGGLTWRPSASDTLSNTVNFSLSDIRNFGYIESHYQAANLAINTLQSTSAYSSATYIAGLGWSASGDGQSSMSARVDVKYNHWRVLDVKGLRYLLTINVTKYQNVNAYGNTVGSNRDSYLFDQKIEYGIGRAYLRLNGSVYKFGKSKSTLIVLQLGRNFGDI